MGRPANYLIWILSSVSAAKKTYVRSSLKASVPPKQLKCLDPIIAPLVGMARRPCCQVPDNCLIYQCEVGIKGVVKALRRRFLTVKRAF
jgi:hypothetical protein